eukprot:5951845-Pyramimonas_sp.AAC.1
MSISSLGTTQDPARMLRMPAFSTERLRDCTLAASPLLLNGLLSHVHTKPSTVSTAAGIQMDSLRHAVQLGHPLLHRDPHKVRPTHANVRVAIAPHDIIIVVVALLAPVVRRDGRHRHRALSGRARARWQL